MTNKYLIINTDYPIEIDQQDFIKNNEKYLIINFAILQKTVHSIIKDNPKVKPENIFLQISGSCSVENEEDVKCYSATKIWAELTVNKCKINPEWVEEQIIKRTKIKLKEKFDGSDPILSRALEATGSPSEFLALIKKTEKNIDKHYQWINVYNTLNSADKAFKERELDRRKIQLFQLENILRNKKEAWELAKNVRILAEAEIKKELEQENG